MTGPSQAVAAGDGDLARRVAELRQLVRGGLDDSVRDRIVELLCGACGDELLVLKQAIDESESPLDVVTLIGVELHDEQRERVLTHFDEQAPAERGPQVRLLSDVDDTVFVSVHDQRYPKGTVYPGVLAFQAAVAAGPDTQLQDRGGETFITARPSDRLGLLDRMIRSDLAGAGVEQPVLMYGSLAGVLSTDARIEAKVANMRLFLRLHRESRVVYMGDSGMADPLVARRMRREMPDAFMAAFIQDISDTPEPVRQEWSREQIHFHDTYVGAILAARRLGLVRDEGCLDVVLSARADFEGVEWDSPAQEDAMRLLLERDIALLEAELHDS